MVSFITNRLAQALLVMLSVSLLAFLMFNFVGDPSYNMLPEDATREMREQLVRQLGLQDPVLIQFGRFVVNTASGNFGLSYRNGLPVARLIAERLPATLELVICSSAFALVLGIPLGIYTGLNRNGALSRLIQGSSLLGISLPSFVIGILLILIFSVNLRWLPSYGRGEVVQIGWWSTGLLTESGLRALILPTITLGVFQLTLVMRLVRSEILEVMGTDYIKFAKARGLSNGFIHFRYALKGALIPVITVIGMQIGSLIAFAIVTESVFQWPGMGALFIQAIYFGDIPVMSAYLIMVAFMFVALNLAVDISYYFIDPRLRH